MIQSTMYVYIVADHLQMQSIFLNMETIYIFMDKEKREPRRTGYTSCCGTLYISRHIAISCDCT